MKTSKIFHKFMKPFLEGHGFQYQNPLPEFYLFIHQDHQDVRIKYTINSKWNQICGEIKKANTRFIPLNVLINGSKEISEEFAGGWYFDTELELIGLLEKHSNILLDWGFDWLFDRIQVDIEGTLRNRAKIREEKWKKSTKEEGELQLKIIGKEFDKWKKTRFLPDKWKV